MRLFTVISFFMCIGATKMTCNDDKQQDITSIILDQSVTEEWNWSFNVTINDRYGKVVLECPSSVFLHNLGISFANIEIGKIVWMVDESKLYTGDIKNRIFNLPTFTIKQVIVPFFNTDEITNLFSVSDMYNQLLYYAKPALTEFHLNLFAYSSQANVATVNRYKSNEKNTWNITVVDPVHFPIDSLLLIAIAITTELYTPTVFGNRVLDQCNRYNFI